MKFELHCHSHYSKGTKLPWEGIPSPREIIRTAKKLGIDGVAITDHINNKCWAEAGQEAKNQGLVFIPAIEIKSREGHVVGLGLSDFIPSGMSLDETLDKIREQGGLSIAVHPYDIRGDGIGDGMERTDAVEIFNSLNMDRITNKFAESRAKKLKKPVTVGSDAHSLGMLGSALNIVDADGTDSLIRELKKNRAKFTRNYIELDTLIEWARRRFELSHDDALRYIDNNYSPLKAWISKRMLNKFLFSEGWFTKSLWNGLGHFGLGMSTIYGTLKVFSYY